LKKEPSVLNSRTPQWFKDWHRSEYWHFKYDVTTRIGRVEKWIWLLIGIMLAATVAERLF